MELTRNRSFCGLGEARSLRSRVRPRDINSHARRTSLECRRPSDPCTHRAATVSFLTGKRPSQDLTLAEAALPTSAFAGRGRQTSSSRLSRITAAVAAKDDQATPPDELMNRAIGQIDAILAHVQRELRSMSFGADADPAMAQLAVDAALASAVSARVKSLDGNFMSALGAYRAAALAKGNDDLVELLDGIRNEVLVAVASKMPRELQVLDALAKASGRGARQEILRSAVTTAPETKASSPSPTKDSPAGKRVSSTQPAPGRASTPAKGQRTSSSDGPVPASAVLRSIQQLLDDLHEGGAGVDLSLQARLCLVREDLLSLLQGGGSAVAPALKSLPRKEVDFSAAMASVTNRSELRFRLKDAFSRVEDGLISPGVTSAMVGPEAGFAKVAIKPATFLDVLRAVTEEAKARGNEPERQEFALRLMRVYKEAISVLEEMCK